MGRTNNCPFSIDTVWIDAIVRLNCLLGFEKTHKVIYDNLGPYVSGS